MPDLKPTAAMRKVLDAADRGVLTRDTGGLGTRRLYSPYCTDGTPVTSRTVDACFDARWLTVVDAWTLNPRLVLTDAGRDALGNR